MMGRFIQLGGDHPSHYKGLMIRANPRLHTEVANRISKIAKQGSKVLDMGAGQGAFSQRLSDLGYVVEAVDTNVNDFKANHVIFHQLNFNSANEVNRFIEAYQGKFDVVVGMEVIEHVENPWNYLRMLKALTKEDGYVVTTTPNIESWVSKLSFMFNGSFFHFSDNDYRKSGHINPISSFEMRTLGKGLELELVELEAICRLPTVWLSKNMRLICFSILNCLFGTFLGDKRKGDILLAIFRRNSHSVWPHGA